MMKRGKGLNGCCMLLLLSFQHLNYGYELQKLYFHRVKMANIFGRIFFRTRSHGTKFA